MAPQLGDDANLDGMPATHLDVGSRDLVASNVRSLRDHLRAAGVSVDYLQQDGGAQDFPLYLQTAEGRNGIAAQSEWASLRLPN